MLTFSQIDHGLRPRKGELRPEVPELWRKVLDVLLEVLVLSAKVPEVPLEVRTLPRNVPALPPEAPALPDEVLDVFDAIRHVPATFFVRFSGAFEASVARRPRWTRSLGHGRISASLCRDSWPLQNLNGHLRQNIML